MLGSVGRAALERHLASHPNFTNRHITLTPTPKLACYACLALSSSICQACVRPSPLPPPQCQDLARGIVRRVERWRKVRRRRRRTGTCTRSSLTPTSC